MSGLVEGIFMREGIGGLYMRLIVFGLGYISVIMAGWRIVCFVEVGLNSFGVLFIPFYGLYVVLGCAWL